MCLITELGVQVLKDYYEHIDIRAKLGIPPKPLNTLQVKALIELLKKPPIGKESLLLKLMTNMISPGVNESSYVKAKFLSDIIKNITYSPLINRIDAVKLLGTMQGGYNIEPLIETLNEEPLAQISKKILKNTILMFNKYSIIENKANEGNLYAKEIIFSWAKLEWFFSRLPLKNKITLTVFKVSGETNTDDLSPATDAWSRTDIPLHALTMLKNPREGIIPDKPGEIGPINQINSLKNNGFPLAYVGDIIGTGSSRKSAANSILWHIGRDIPYVPNKRNGGIILGSKIAPIFFNTMEDSGAFPIEVDVSLFKMGDIIDIYPYLGEIRCHQTNRLLINFEIKNKQLIDEVRAGGRIYFIIGHSLTDKSRNFIKSSGHVSSHFKKNEYPNKLLNSYKKIHNYNLSKREISYTLAQKIVGKACGKKGISPGEYCEPKITSLGSQDTTGPMTVDELNDLACLNFSADLVLQSFCHTAAYPNKLDLNLHKTLPTFIVSRGGICLRPGDGIIHSWLNRMLIPDTVGTGGDSHTRFPIGISFPSGSGLLAFTAATGIMPLNMPESVLVRFTGIKKPWITIRDLVHAIPYYSIKCGLLSLNKKNKRNIFYSRIIEIEGLEYLNVEQAFEVSNSSAERSAIACSIRLCKESIIEYLLSNIVLLKSMIFDNYNDSTAIAKRVKKMQQWLKNPTLLSADKNAEYSKVIEIDISKINEPIICLPDDPDNVCLLSEVSGNKVDEVFIGSCMMNINHFRVVGDILNNNKLSVNLWIAPPTRMDVLQLIKEGYYETFNRVGARLEIPGCSLCMGNQARVNNVTVLSTSTRNFPNRLGNNTKVYLGSAELAAITAVLGYIPTLKEYISILEKIKINKKRNLYNYLRFNEIKDYIDKASQIKS